LFFYTHHRRSLYHDTYGDEFGSTGSPQTPWGFTGEQTDENGLLYLRARYYNPTLGQFISLDPVETDNRFAYVGGNPVNRRDPSGLQPPLPIAECLKPDGEWDLACIAQKSPQLLKELSNVSPIVDPVFANKVQSGVEVVRKMGPNGVLTTYLIIQGAMIPLATLGWAAALGLGVGSLFVLSAMIEHTPYTAKQLADMKVPTPSQGDLDKAKKVLTSVTGQCSPQPQLEPAPNAPNPPNSNDRKNDPCDKLQPPTGSVADVVGNVGNIRPSQEKVFKSAMMHYAKRMCRNEPTPSLYNIPYYRDVNNLSTDQFIANAHHRFVAARFMNKPFNMVPGQPELLPDDVDDFDGYTWATTGWDNSNLPADWMPDIPEPR
jgi:RHS repeat-associated protein